MNEHQVYVNKIMERANQLKKEILRKSNNEKKRYIKCMFRDINQWLRDINRCQITYQTAISLVGFVDESEDTKDDCQKIKKVFSLRIDDMQYEKEMGSLLKKKLQKCRKENNYDSLVDLYDSYINLMILYHSILMQTSIDIKAWNYHLDNIVYFPNESEEENIKSMKVLIKEQLSDKKNLKND